MNEKPRTIEKALRPRSRLLVLLGDQLIRDANMAVFELVKNAYDADATKCIVSLEHVHEENPALAKIVVLDNGTGMDLDTVVNHWLEPGTDLKSQQRRDLVRSPLGRLPLGEKGVGRFASHKLGQHIEVVTKRRGNLEVVVRIDWRVFDPDSATGTTPKYLDEIPIRVVEREPEVFLKQSSGTRITVTQLRELPWSRRAVRSLHRAVTGICSPLSDRSSFAAVLAMNPDVGWLEGMLSYDEVIGYSLFQFNAILSGTTLDYEYTFEPTSAIERKKVTRRTNKVKGFPLLRAPEPGERAEPIDIPEGSPSASRKRGVLVDLSAHDIGQVEVQLYMYDLDLRVLNLLLKNPKSLKDYLDSNGGVRVYRDGIRIYDFGEPGNDWLDLEGKRVNVPSARIGNNQVIGSVLLKLEGSNSLVEKTNREGFVENDAYRAFHAAIACAVAQAAVERNVDKERLRKATEGRHDRTPVLDELQELRAGLRKKKLESDFDKILQRIEYEHRRVRESLLLAAGTGLNLGAVIHTIEKDIKYLVLLLKRNADRAEIEKAVTRLSRLTDTMSWLLSDAPESVVQASTLLHQVVETWRFRFEHHRIQLIDGFTLESPCKDFQRKMSRKLIATALMNLVDNAIYWVGTRESSRKIYIGTTTELGDGPAIVVADNGPGLQGDDPEVLSQPFFTRKPNGTGLGLHIAAEVMKQHGGSLEFPSPGDIELPRGLNGAVVALQFGGR
jgi:signal transduction histidine kinase